MNKIDMMSKNQYKYNVEKLKELFPNVVSEDKIDFEILKQELSEDILDEKKEKYQLTWPGKKESIVNANTPITKTLRPLKEKSLNFDNTKNIYIEGDNLEVLKILQESYLNKIDCIYIDPPYNTGNNLIYKNDFSRDSLKEEYESGVVGENGEKLVTNSRSNGRFHSDWLSMIYSRLKLARNLLKKDGIIVMAIDDNEYANFKKIADEIFGEASYIGTIVTRCNPQGRGKKNIDPCHEYHMIYCKSFEDMPDLKLNVSETDKDYKNFMRSGTNSRKYERPRRFYPMLVKNDVVSCIEYEEYKKIYDEPNRQFNEEFIKELNQKYTNLGFNVIWPIAQNGEEKVWQRIFERAVTECHEYIYQGNQIKTPGGDERTAMSLWLEDINSNVVYGTNKLNALFDNSKVFDYSKSIYTVKDLISLGNNKIVLDFFSGSATTAHAVMSLNAQDNGDRKFILVQLPENCEENPDAEKFGFKTICDVGEERIRRAGKQIKEETNANIDYGFRVYKVDSSNMKDIFYKPSELTQLNILDLASNIKEDRSPEDLLIQVILDLGLTLDLKIEERRILNNKVFYVEDNSLIACFDDKIDISIIDEICKYNPLKVVFKDSSFKSDKDKINLEEKIKKLSPETEVSVL